MFTIGNYFSYQMEKLCSSWSKSLSNVKEQNEKLDLSEILNTEKFLLRKIQ